MWLLSASDDTRGDSITRKENRVRFDRRGDLRTRSSQMFVPDECLETNCLPSRPNETPSAIDGSSFGEVCIRYSHPYGSTFAELGKSSKTTRSREDLRNISSVQIFEEKQLMDYIIREFIPETSISTGKHLLIPVIVSSSLFLSIDDEHLYGQLFPEALKLCRVLASHGSSLASNLIHRYELYHRLRNHLLAAVK
jgi:hypothetical protein